MQGFFDIVDFYLGTPMQWYEYMFIYIKDIPADIVEQYNVNKIGKENCFVELSCNGIIKANMLTYPCQDRYTVCYINIIIIHRSANNIHHTRINKLCTGKKY